MAALSVRLNAAAARCRAMIEPFIFSTEADWLAALRAEFLAEQAAALARRPVFHVALSGGTTPVPFYHALAREALDWDRFAWWMGDERCAPDDSPANNGRMARRAFAEVNVRFRFHPWDVARPPEEAAAHYAVEMRTEIGAPPVFDLLLLGLGEDGHTASLFPGSPALSENARDATAAPGPPPHTRRLTLTYPTLNRARAAWFLVAGGAKAPMVRRLLDGDETLPAARLRGPVQKLFWSRAETA
ncbi:MAG: 6-phosphogluconolactonase [Verrucomicrobiae bacterium]|nr:6-phosphogluconolactonase [Verrucomicrobiae bacterium]